MTVRAESKCRFIKTQPYFLEMALAGEFNEESKNA